MKNLHEVVRRKPWSRWNQVRKLSDNFVQVAIPFYSQVAAIACTTAFSGKVVSGGFRGGNVFLCT